MRLFHDICFWFFWGLRTHWVVTEDKWCSQQRLVVVEGELMQPVLPWVQYHLGRLWCRITFSFPSPSSRPRPISSKDQKWRMTFFLFSLRLKLFESKIVWISLILSAHNSYSRFRLYGFILCSYIGFGSSDKPLSRNTKEVYGSKLPKRKYIGYVREKVGMAMCLYLRHDTFKKACE